MTEVEDDAVKEKTNNNVWLHFCYLGLSKRHLSFVFTFINSPTLISEGRSETSEKGHCSQRTK